MSMDQHPNSQKNIPISVLDLSPVLEGSTVADALRNTLDLAQHVEKWGYNRYWLAEHHNMSGIASSATSVVIAMSLLVHLPFEWVQVALCYLITHRLLLQNISEH